MLMAYAETPTRRRQVYKAIWKFGIGATVTCDAMNAIVLGRSRTAMGRELYDVMIRGEAYGRPLRTIQAAGLKAPHDEPLGAQ